MNSVPMRKEQKGYPKGEGEQSENTPCDPLHERCRRIQTTRLIQTAHPVIDTGWGGAPARRFVGGRRNLLGHRRRDDINAEGLRGWTETPMS